MKCGCKLKGFTLIELLVVVAIIALLIAILIPSLARAKQNAVTAKCLSNLHQCGMGMTMYSNDWDQFLPYPTTTMYPTNLWFNAIDPYLAAMVDTTRSGVAGQRSYQKYKQCPVLDGILGDKTSYGSTGAQNTTTEYCRSYKMNSMLRSNNPYYQVKIQTVPNPSNFVEIGDGMAMDFTGTTPSQYDNGQFSMEVNSTGANASCPALRHSGGACIVFVDCHAEREVLPLLNPAVPLGNAPFTAVQRWQSEYISGGAQYNPPTGSTSLPAGVARNPAMPLQWSDVGTLYR